MNAIHLLKQERQWRSRFRREIKSFILDMSSGRCPLKIQGERLSEQLVIPVWSSRRGQDWRYKFRSQGHIALGLDEII